MSPPQATTTTEDAGSLSRRQTAFMVAALVAFERNVVIVLVPLLGLAFGVGSSLGFAWAGPIVGQGTVSGFHSALWVSVAIGIVALAMSLILKPRPVE